MIESASKNKQAKQDEHKEIIDDLKEQMKVNIKKQQEKTDDLKEQMKVNNKKQQEIIDNIFNNKIK